MATTNKTQEKKAEHQPGKFVWFEVRTPTPSKTAKFFSEVVGWNISTMQMGEGAPYTLASTKSGPVAGVVEDARAAFVSYVSVEDVDAAARRVEKAGGNVIGKPFDVPTIGRMVEVQDADGAAFFLFKSETGDPEMPSAEGAFLWNELWAKNESRALAFLTSVLGYTVEGMPMGGTTYNVLKAQGKSAAGLMKSPVKELAAHWLPYLRVDDVEAAQKRAAKLGAKLEGDVTEVAGIGRFAFVRAPDGCRFAVMTPATA
jgi:predicted enzyme related to lactoylglutathione lyase